ncbi:MAG: sigma-70 family RNA polymerase sigma factor [Oscillospiraceae bacterium]|nr:sigma-70 family RNA polymerase sigma factor [Oscillospiraceae bacterium]
MGEEKILSAIQAVLNGDANAFEVIVRAYEKNVYNIALRMTSDREDALDISQEAFLKAYHSLHTYRGEGSFSVWLYRIVSNTCLDFMRSRSRRNEVSLSVEDESGETAEMEIRDDSLSPERLYERKLTRESLRKGLMRLPEDQRKILLLREIQGLSYEEIARVLSIEGGTVKSRIYRARRKLCEYLAGDGNISPSSSSDKMGGGDMP